MALPTTRRRFGPVSETADPDFFDNLQFFWRTACPGPRSGTAGSHGLSADAVAGTAGGPGVVFLIHVSAVDRLLLLWSGPNAAGGVRCHVGPARCRVPG